MGAPLVRVLPLAAVLAFAATVWGQVPSLKVGGKAYSLAPSKLVAGEASRAIWSPDGADLAYVVNADEGTSFGVFNMKRSNGAIVATFAKGEELEQVLWLNSGHKALLVTRRRIEGRAVETHLLRIQMADAELLKSQQLWAGEYPTADHAAVELDLSPSLAHALISISGAKAKAYLVLTESAKAIVPSLDLEQAAHRGLSMAGWSKHGSAIFSSVLGSVEVNGSKPGSFAIDVSYRVDTDMASGVFKIIGIRGPPIQPGETVLECMPSNGVLRQVRFPGYFEDQRLPQGALQPATQQVDLHQGKTTAGVQSLWLVPFEQGKEASEGLLVSAESQGAWLSPTGRAIAFTCHGALFVRRIDIDN